VSSFRHIIAVVLLALWLPMTQHCDLEAAGLIAGEVPHSATVNCSEPASSRCGHHDGGSVAEGNLVKQSNDPIKVPMPSLVACTCFLCLQLLTPQLAVEPALAVAESDHPQHWVPVWQFVRRAAPLSRAPSLLG
jgi:hypothetical protein